MVHMFSVLADAALCLYQNRPRMVYITNTELDDSGSVGAIHSHRETAEVALVYRRHGAHKIENRIYDSEPGGPITRTFCTRTSPAPGTNLYAFTSAAFGAFN